MKKTILFLLVAICLAGTFGYAQQAPRAGQQPTTREDALDPTPIDPAVDPNLDMFINNWKNVPAPYYVRPPCLPRYSDQA